MRNILVPALMLSAIALLSPPVARAHPLVDQARERFRSADFPGAIEALREAEEASDLDRTDVVALYELRAVIHMALREIEPADEALRALASLEPSHRFAREVPPDVVDRFRILRATVPGRVAIEVSRRETPDGFRLEPRALDDPLQLIRRLRVHARVDRGPWSTAEGQPLFVRADAGQVVEWYAVGLGPGDATLASVGDARAPMQLTVGDDPLREGSVGPWLWVGLGAAAVAAAVVVVVLVTQSGEPDTRVAGPSGWP